MPGRWCRWGAGLLLPLFVLLAGRGSARAAEMALTTAAQVHDLPAKEAARGVPVHLLATVSYYAPAESTLFLTDASGGVYVQTTHAYRLHRGDLVRVDGVTAPSFRTTVAADPKIVVVGTGALRPLALRGDQSYHELMAGRWDCRYVSLRGVVRLAVRRQQGGAELEVLMPGGIVQVDLEDQRGIDLRQLLDAEVKVSGVVGGDYDATWDLMRTVLYGAGASDLQIVRRPKVQPLQLPATAVDAIRQTREIEDRSQRVRVRGTVTYYQPGTSVVVEQRDGRSLFASTREIDPIPLGAIVDLSGFASDGGYGPELSEAEIFPTGQVAPIAPTPVGYAQAIDGAYNARLVSLQGRILSEQHGDASDTLFLRVEDHTVTVVLQAREQRDRLPELPLGAMVEVSGICRITPTVAWGTPGITPMIFRLDMRSRQDVRVLVWPSWWTVAHLLLVLGALLALSLLITVWAMVLRRRVAQQTAEVERTMRVEQERSRLLEAINAETSLEELLEEILGSVAALTPGLECGCTIANGGEEPNGVEGGTGFGAAPARVSFAAPLTDRKGRQIGRFEAGGAELRRLSTYETEVLQVGAGLANLAVNQRRMYEELNYTSTHDQLTALPNRRLSDVSLETALQEAVESDLRLGVAYIDVDRFKQVNDQHGHKVGDLYLQQIAARLMGKVRAEDKLARIGGDEFLLIATGLHSIADAEAYRQRLESCFESNFVLEGAQVCGSASIGIAVFPDHGASAEELKRHADIDMYAVKNRRRTERQQEQRMATAGE